MAEYKVIKLGNLSPLHIGTGTENYYTSAAELQSDTVSSALAAVGIQTGILKSDEIQGFLSSFKISSAFPYCSNVFYLPISGGKIQLNNHVYEKKHRKELKKIKYLSADYFSEWSVGKQLKKEVIDDNKYSSSKKTIVAQRVTITDNLATPFFFEWSYFKDNCGLYFIIDSDNETFDKVFKLFEILGEFGIGTDKNVGGGKFVPKNDKITLPDVDNSNATMILSSYIPTEDELSKLDLENSNYQLEKRGGFIAGSENESFRHLRKRSIYMFAAGSIFATTETFTGKIENLAPQYENMHPVYRSGRALTLKIKTQQQ